ncbi:MAG TPA: choice-of-anchor Q domain-containing protein [Anaerolineales bacterium]|nr:choice-of-anchor Q domain-containing protein [Anaerolineales bacterium]
MRKTINSSVPHKLLTALVILSMVMVALPATTAFAAGSTISVTTTDDEYDGGPLNVCSLREAIALANHPTALTLNDCSRSVAGPDDEIVLQSGQTYLLDRTGAGGTSEGDLDIGDNSGLSGNLTISTTGSAPATINGNGTDRVFDVGAAGNPGLTLNNIIVTNGNTTGLLSSTTGGGISFAGTGTLSLINSTVSNNVSASSTGCGGGIYNNSAATVVITDSTISGNSCPNGNADGAGMLKGGGGTLTVTGSTFSGNTVGENGGGMHIGGSAATTVNITNSTFANNTAGNRGGGLQVGNAAAVVTIDFTTFSGNSASESTLTPPGLDGGGALQVTAGTVTVTRSILANSTSTNPGTPEDCDVSTSVTTVSVSDSIIETNVDSADSDCGPSGVLNVDPQLGALANNGGPTQTMGISLSSPAYNAADSCGSVVVDQRGATRPQVGACDLGAFESGNTTAPVVSNVTRATTNPTNDPSVDFTVTFSLPVTGVDATDFQLVTTGVTGASITGVSGSGTSYTVTVNTGSGDGTIQLNVLDNGSIASGGDGLDGGFTNGEVYDVDKTLPTVTISRADPNILSSATVDFGVSFSEAVTGVNTADFNLAVSSGITGASISGISGSGATYTVTVNTGTGDGTIGLNLNGAGTGIADAAGNAIGGAVTGEVYTILRSAAAVDVDIAGTNVGDGIIIPFNNGQRVGFAVDNGPAKVYSTNGFDIVAALRVIWREPGLRTSYSEMMGLPVEQLSSEYWFPWYNNRDVASMDQGFRIANVDSSDTTVKVMLGTTELDSFTLAAGASVRTAYDVNSGPIRIYSVEGNKILAALRVIWKEPGPRYSYSEMMGLPVEQLSTEYWYPWYNNLDIASMDQGFRIASVNGIGDNTVEVWAAGVLKQTFSLAQGASVRVGYEVNDGPVQVRCTTCSGAEKIITSLRVIWKEPGFRATYSEMMGMPLEQLSTTYWFPWYNNADVNSMDQGFRIAIVNGSGENTVQVFVAGALQESITLIENESVRVGYNANNGPAKIVCTTCTLDEKIVTSLRVIWKEPGVRTSYSEMMGLPNEALSNEYWFPWYNNLFQTSIMDQGFRISVP